MEVEAEEVARTRLRLKREAYHGRQETELDHHPANAGADGWIEDVVALLDPPEFWTLTRLIGTRVQTIRGRGVLWDHKGREARVVLDTSPKVWTPPDVGELLLSEGAA